MNKGEIAGAGRARQGGHNEHTLPSPLVAYVFGVPHIELMNRFSDHSGALNIHLAARYAPAFGIIYNIRRMARPRHLLIGSLAAILPRLGRSLMRFPLSSF